jgi:hypothetical protein
LDLQWQEEGSDPGHPAFIRVGDDVVKWASTKADHR